MALTPKRARFVEEYLVDLNAAQAAIRAGYSRKTAREQGCQLLRKLEIVEAIAAGRAALRERTDVTADEVIRGLARIARADMRDYASWGDGQLTVVPSDALTADQAAAISEISMDRHGRVKVKLHRKEAAWASLARHFGLFRDKLEHSASDDLKAFLDRISDRGRTRAD